MTDENVAYLERFREALEGTDHDVVFVEEVNVKAKQWCQASTYCGEEHRINHEDLLITNCIAHLDKILVKPHNYKCVNYEMTRSDEPDSNYTHLEAYLRLY